MKARARLLSKLTYKRGAFIKPHQWPTVPTLGEGMEIKACELMATGQMMHEGIATDFVELRVYAGRALASDAMTDDLSVAQSEGK